MKGKAMLSALAAMGLLALSATVAQAGSGGTPSLLTSFFVCHEIHGEDPGKDFDVESPVFGPVDPSSGASILQRIKIGKGALACAFARLFAPGNPVPIEPVEPGTGVEQMTCYPISNSQKAKVQPPTQYTLIDALVGTEVDVSVPASKLQYLCAPANFLQAVNQDGAPEGMAIPPSGAPEHRSELLNLLHQPRRVDEVRVSRRPGGRVVPVASAVTTGGRRSAQGAAASNAAAARRTAAS